MKLNIRFGLLGDKEVDWWKSIDSFPKTIVYLNVIHEWVFYNDDKTGKYDKVLWFAELKRSDPRYNEEHETWSHIFENHQLECCCGARYSSFPWDHLRYCPEWKKW